MPRALQSLAFLTRQPAFMRRARNRYGDMFSVKIFGFPGFVILSDPDLIKQMYTEDVKVLHAGTESPLEAVLGAHSLLTIDEDYHLSQRRLLLPAFHGERMRGYVDVFAEIADREFDSWPSGEEFAVLPAMQRITLQAILRTVFGAHGASLNRLETLMPEMVNLGQRLVLIKALQKDWGPRSPWGRFLRLKAEMVEEVQGLVDEARADANIEERGDVLAILVQAKHEDDTPMADEEIIDQLFTLLVAGHETTATTLAWCVERLRRNPHVLQKVTQSVRAGDTDYLDAVISETLRMRPTVNFAVRIAMRDYEIGGYVVPKGTRFASNPALTHDDPRLFDDPRSFVPERFLDGRPSSYAYIPFGGGVRRCIGAAFAQMEAQVVMRRLLERFDLVPTEAPDEPWRFHGVTFVPQQGGMTRVRKHSAPPVADLEPELATAAV